MHNNYHFLKRLANELEQKYLGYRLETCFSQDKDELILGFSDDKNEIYIKALVSPSFSCLSFTGNFSRARKNTVELLQEILGQKILNISVFENERALKIALEHNYEIVFKFFGNRPNILLFKNQNLISLFNKNILSDNEIVYAQLNRNLDLSFENFEKMEGNFRKIYVTLGKAVFQNIEKYFAENPMSLKQKWEYIHQIISDIENCEIYVGTENKLPVLRLIEPETVKNSYHSAIDAINSFYIFYQSDFSFEKELDKQIKLTNKEIIRTENYIKETQSKLEKLKTGASNEEIANILMANLHLISEGSENVSLFNFYTNQQENIKLKTELSPQKNAENFYRKAKNQKIEFDNIEKSIATSESKLADLNIRLEKLQQSQNLKELRQIIKGENAEIKANSKSEKEMLFKNYAFMGYEILVGKNAKNNDILTLKFAQKEDIWLHARDTPGSHVVIKTKPNTKVPNPVLEYAASLAAAYSKRKNEKIVPVIYTFKKFVRKKKGFKDGEVHLDKESVLMIEPIKEV